MSTTVGVGIKNCAQNPTSLWGWFSKFITMVLTKWQSRFWYTWPRFSKDWEKSNNSCKKTSCLVFLLSILWCGQTGNHPEEDLVKSGYRLVIKILKIKNDDKSGPIFFLKNLFVCVCVKIIFSRSKNAKIRPRETTASCLSFLKTSGSFKFLNRWFSDSEIFKNLESMVVCFSSSLKIWNGCLLTKSNAKCKFIITIQPKKFTFRCQVQVSYKKWMPDPKTCTIIKNN